MSVTDTDLETVKAKVEDALSRLKAEEQVMNHLKEEKDTIWAAIDKLRDRFLELHTSMVELRTEIRTSYRVMMLVAGIGFTIVAPVLTAVILKLIKL